MMEDLRSVTDEQDGGEEARRAIRGRIVKTMMIVLLLILLLLIPLRAQKFLWYAQNIRCLRCHPEMSARFDQKHTHRPFVERKCLGCHKEHKTVSAAKVTAKNTSRWGRVVERLLPRFVTEDLWNLLLPPGKPEVRGVKAGANDEYLISKEGDLCLSCHREIADQLHLSFPHPPFNGKRCTSCHDPHASDYAQITLKRSDDLCSICHRMDDEFTRRLKHRPFEIRSCPSCHTGHASKFKGLLKAGQKDICFSCHRSVVSQLSLAVQHRPFEAGQCTGCHKPHSSEVDFLLKSRMPEVCYGCHGETRADFSASSKHPVSAKFTCVKCHEPHAGDDPVLLPARGNDVCYRCHYDIKPSFDVIKHSKIKFDRGMGACLGCHRHHGSAYEPLLVDDPVALCRRCHPERFTDMSHPVGGGRMDFRRHSALTCTSTCHWIHYVPSQALLKWQRDELCLICHTGTGYWR